MNYQSSDDFTALFDYDFSSFLLVLIAFISASMLFYSEKQNKTDQLLFTTYIGKKHMLWVKISAFIVYLFAICIIFCLEDVVFHSLFYRLKGWLNPVYAIKTYQLSAFSGSVLSYYITLCLARFVTLACLGMFFVAITLLFDGHILPHLVNLSVLSSLLIFSEQENEVFSHLLNPIVQMQGADLWESFSAINIFGIPILQPQFTLLASFLGVILLAIIGNLISKRKMRSIISHRSKVGAYGQK